MPAFSRSRSSGLFPLGYLGHDICDSTKMVSAGQEFWHRRKSGLPTTNFQLKPRIELLPRVSTNRDSCSCFLILRILNVLLFISSSFGQECGPHQNANTDAQWHCPHRVNPLSIRRPEVHLLLPGQHLCLGRIVTSRIIHFPNFIQHLPRDSVTLNIVTSYFLAHHHGCHQASSYA